MTRNDPGIRSKSTRVAPPSMKEVSMAGDPARHKPGQETPASGLYAEVGPRGGRTGATTVSEKGNPLPPTTEPGNSWVLDVPSGR
jgi:YjzC-like protein